MERVTTVEAVRAAVGRARSSGQVIGLVPTMGALHDGHLALIRLAREHADYVVVSVFVNPAQFGPGEDLDAYPRTLERDAELSAGAGADALFAPSASEMYGEGFSTEVRVTGLSGPLCGASRPGHFDGVALVVAKLLNIVQPDVSVFGQKDAQQALIVRRLVEDLNLPGRVLVGETVREPDGLARSSRNRYLGEEERRAAAALSRGLFAARDAWAAGERDAGRLVGAVREALREEPLVREDYIEVRDLVALEPWTPDAGGALLAVAAHVGPARLIDNVILDAPGAGTGLVTAAGGAHGREAMTDRKGMAILLAAGEGKRMKSDLPKVLHPVAGVPLVARVAEAAKDAGMDRIVVIIGNRAELVREKFADSGWEFVEQTERLGTGDAVKRARKQLETFDGDVLVLAGDVPLLEAATLRTLRERHRESGAAATVLTANLDDATGYGRIVRDDSGEFTGIVEHKDATDAQREITEVNSSIYCFDAGALVSVLDRFSRDNAQGEEYLTDAIGLLRGDGKRVAAVAAATPDEILGVNTREQLREIEEILQRRHGAPEAS